MDGCETLQDPVETLIATWTATPAFDAETISLADHVKVRQMHDAPHAAAGRCITESGQIDRLIHAGIRKTPDERCDREIAGHQHNGIGKRRHDQAMR